MKFNQRDIVLIDFPFTDLSGSKLRPALIISTKLVNVTGDLICLQITSKEYTDGMFFPLSTSHLGVALKLKSGIRLNKVFTVHESLIVKKLSVVKTAAFPLVEKQFREIIF